MPAFFGKHFKQNIPEWHVYANLGCHKFLGDKIVRDYSLSKPYKVFGMEILKVAGLCRDNRAYCSQGSCK